MSIRLKVIRIEEFERSAFAGQIQRTCLPSCEEIDRRLRSTGHVFCSRDLSGRSRAALLFFTNGLSNLLFVAIVGRAWDRRRRFGDMNLDGAILSNLGLQENRGLFEEANALPRDVLSH